MRQLTSGDAATRPGSGRASLHAVDTAARSAEVSEEVRRLAAELLRDERARWAYAIHDGLTQSVAAAILHLEVLSRRTGTASGSDAEDLAAAAADMRSAMADLRALLFNLTTGGADVREPEVRLRACVDEVAGRWKLDAPLAIDGDLLTVPPGVLAVAQILIHEGLTNAAKHAGATTPSATVAVHVDADGLTVSVRDRGHGFDHTARHFGLRMLERRIRETGGTLSITSSDLGSCLCGRFPREAW